MGTRADFYAGIGAESEWLGSIAWDGFPEDMPALLMGSMSETAFREQVASFLKERDDGTTPDMGWPWPWNDSSTTDYSYTYHDTEVYWSSFGGPWIPASNGFERGDDDGEMSTENALPDAVVFPDMSSKSRPAIGTSRDSIMVVRSN